MRLAASATRRALQPDGRASRAPWRNLNAVARVHPGHGQTTAQRITPMQQHLMPSTKLINRLLIALFLIAISALGNWAGAQNVAKSVITTEQVRAELMVHAPQGADAGKTVWVGLQLTHQPEWHTYWKNSGDSGQATSAAGRLGSSSTSCPACSRCWPSRWWALPATRKTGAPTASAAWPTPRGGAVVPGAGRAHAGPAGGGRGRGLGLSAAVARRGGGAGGLFTLIGLNLAGCLSLETCCRRQWPACRRATRWPTAS
jgi:hypothetical protein